MTAMFVTIGSRAGMRLLVCGLVVLVTIGVAARTCEAYVRFSCGSNGIVSLLSASNERGETLLAWQNDKTLSGGFCESAVAEAAVGSTVGGFGDLGTISAPGELSYATGVALDGAGDGWVVGLHETYAGRNKYGPTFEESGAWAAFRPAGGGFRAPVELPTKGGAEEEAWVASNRAGRTVLAWSSFWGTYLAFGSTSGTISKPAYIGGFHVSGVGVDESGRALVVGYYGVKEGGGASRIAVVTAGASESFSRPRVVARQVADARTGRVLYFAPPLVAIGPHGNAVIAYKSDWANRRLEYEFSGPNFLLYRQANGRFDKAARLPGGFLEGDESTAAVDATGRAIVVSSTTDQGLKEIAISSRGHMGHQRHLWGYAGYAPGVASNAQGQVIIAWANPEPIEILHGNTGGANGKLQTVAHTELLKEKDTEIAATINSQGVATVFWIKVVEEKERILYAESVTPGAQPVEIASSGSSSPVAVSGIGDAVEVSAEGTAHTCAALSSGGAKCWGANEAGQLGDGESGEPSPTPVEVRGLGGDAVTTGGGRDFACALLSDKSVECWGENEEGQFGDGTTTNSLKPVPVSGL